MGPAILGPAILTEAGFFNRQDQPLVWEGSSALLVRQRAGIAGCLPSHLHPFQGIEADHLRIQLPAVRLCDGQRLCGQAVQIVNAPARQDIFYGTYFRGQDYALKFGMISHVNIVG